MPGSQQQDDRQEFLKLCVNGMAKRGLSDDRHRQRLKFETRYIGDIGDYSYFLEQVATGHRFATNENNLLVAYVLGLVEDFDIERDPGFKFGESPDIDTDYVSPVQKYLKDDWAPLAFGPQNVCPIGNYNTFGIKSGFIASARVYGKDRIEIQSITKTLEDKDEDGKPVTFDTAYQICPELKAYAERNPEVEEAARALFSRNMGLGKHAGGLIIANSPITQYVPLIKNKEESTLVSAFVEGLHGQDLGPMGLIKYDLLVVSDLERLAFIKRRIKERHGLDSFCALPGQSDWTDRSYLNDPAALKMADRADLRGIFQFDSPGIRNLVKSGGVTSFDDLAAYSAMFRPGILALQGDKTYVRRKKGQEKYDLHPLIEPILGVTYGVSLYQEQIMALLHKVGGIPLTRCEQLRKAISKKKIKEFAADKDKFVTGGMERLGWSEEQLNELWAGIESWSGYGFNRSHTYSYAYTSARLLYGKAHYPLEFFEGTLAMEGDTEKLREYKLDAERHGIKVKRVDINRSGWNFRIVGDDVYMGFSNIKGVGEAVAKRIVENQPYTGFEDFILRFGSEANVLKPLICLGVFDSFDTDRCKLLEFSEHYRKTIKSRADRDKRAEGTRDGIVESFQTLLRSVDPEVTDEHCRSTMADMSKYDVFADMVRDSKGGGADDKELHKIAKKFRRCVDTLKQKQAADGPITMAEFVPTGDLDPDLKAVCSEIMPVAESRFYGFNWDHVLKYSPDFEGGMTLSRFMDETAESLPVEVQIVKPAEKRTSKKESATVYYQMKVEDADSVQATVNIWQEDFNRFQAEFTAWDKAHKGSMMRVRLSRPSKGFPTYTFESPPRHLRTQQIPTEKDQDHRVVMYRSPYRTSAPAVEATTSSSTPETSTDTFTT